MGPECEGISTGRQREAAEVLHNAVEKTRREKQPMRRGFHIAAEPDAHPSFPAGTHRHASGSCTLSLELQTQCPHGPQAPQSKDEKPRRDTINNSFLSQKTAEKPNIQRLASD